MRMHAVVRLELRVQRREPAERGTADEALTGQLEPRVEVRNQFTNDRIDQPL